MTPQAYHLSSKIEILDQDLTTAIGAGGILARGDSNRVFIIVSALVTDALIAGDTCITMRLADTGTNRIVGVINSINGQWEINRERHGQLLFRPFTRDLNGGGSIGNATVIVGRIITKVTNDPETATEESIRESISVY